MSGIVATFYLISVGQPAVVTRDSFFFDQGVFDTVSKNLNQKCGEGVLTTVAGCKSGTH
jgi:hypothetical protein